MYLHKRYVTCGDTLSGYTAEGALTRMRATYITIYVFYMVALAVPVKSKEVMEDKKEDH